MKREEARKLAEELVDKMTVDEMASQLIYHAPAIPRLGIKEYNWWNEALHGVARGGTATCFPQAIGMAATFDDELLEKVADAISTEVRAKYNAISKKGDRDIYKGLTMWSPNINIFRDPRWGRGHETYGEDPYLTSRMGSAFVRGLQGNGEHLKAAACAKHFCVHSGPEATRHHFNAIATKKDMHETYLPAFKELVDTGVEAVMGAYNRVNGEPACANNYTMNEILRGKWGFEGHYVSDCWAIRDFYEGHEVTENELESVKLALEMGCDLNCGSTYEFVMDAYSLRLINEDVIKRSAIRLFTTRFLLGIEKGQTTEYDDIPYTKVECKEHLDLALKAAHKSCVLFKNDGILPLNKKTCGTVGVIGPNANSRASLIGNYHGTPSDYITVQEGLMDYLKDEQRILFSEGSDIYRKKVENLAKPDDRIAEAIVTAENSDTVILVVGLDENIEGEQPDEGNFGQAGDKENLLLPECQRNLIDEILKVGKPTVIVTLAGSSIDLSEYEDKANAVLLGWYPGEMGGKAITDILFGEVSPSGKLPVTFYKNSALDEMPGFEDYSMNNRTYRYYTGKPYHPFGYGLTYGECKVEEYNIDIASGKVTAKVKNYGKMKTDDVIQVYVKDLDSKFAPTNPCLCGFKRINLDVNEEKIIEFELNKNAFTVVNDEGERIDGSGNYEFIVRF